MCDRYQAKEPIAVWRGASVHSLHRSRRRVIAGIAAAASLAAVLVVAAVVAERSRWPDVLETATAENDTFSLRDGSTVALGGASRVRVSMAPERRSLVLERGEAFFEVARDAKRPFTVRAGDAEITAIGTAFNVRRSADRVLVAVTHGVVKITPTHGDTGSRESLLRAGQQTVLSPVAWSAPAPAEIAVVVAWRNGRLRYESEPLRYVVADVARYSKVPVEITDPDVGSIPVTTTVLERDLQGWLQGLEQALPVEVEFGEERITISRKRAAAGPGE
jgi:transmembrane sensor